MSVDQTKGTKLSQVGFILSILGAAVGLGNIWGFPTQMYRNGGATFLIPFFIAILVCGLPILILEINLGNKWRKSQVKIFEEFAGTSGRFFGFLQSVVVWGMISFYSILVAWSVISLVVSVVPSWLNENNFFHNKVLQISKDVEVSSFSSLGTINWYVLLAYLFVWGLVLVIVNLGAVNGIAKANKIFMPGLFFLLIGMAIYSTTLSGASIGLEKLFAPDLTKLSEVKTWTSAFQTAFFTLSICTAVIIIFSGYAPKDQDNANQAFIVVLGDLLVGMITSIIIFSGIGHISFTENKPFAEVFGSGDTSLVFSVFPKIFGQINAVNFGWGNFLGVVFFLTIFFAGISSLIMGVEVVASPLYRDLKVKRIWATIISCMGAFTIGFILIFKNAVALIDGIAIWVAGIWQLIIGVVQVVGICWKWKQLNNVCEHNNATSWIQLKRTFKWSLLFFTPIILISILVMNVSDFYYKCWEQPFIFAGVGLFIGVVLVLSTTAFLTFYLQIKKRFLTQRRKDNVSTSY